MKCDEVLMNYAESAKDRRLSIRQGLHILRCPSCSASARRLDLAMDVLKTDCFPDSPDYTAAIMKSLNQEPAVEGQPVSFRNWLVGGVLLVSAMVFSPMGSDFAWVVERFGTGYLLPMNMVLSLVFTGYVGLFVGTHLGEISDKFNLHRD